MRIKFLVSLIILSVIYVGCKEDYYPKPKAYFRIDLPDHTYLKYNESCPFTFDFLNEAVVKDERKQTQDCWLNIEYPKFNATIHLSYIPIENNVNKYIEDARTLAYKHTVKAMDINETLIIRDSSSVYGLLYTFEGNTATGVQFYVTDSINHFLRGALYFNVSPNEDSLYPVAEFITKDVEHLISSVNWKE